MSEKDDGNRGALIAAAIILGGFGFGAYFMPSIMLAVGEKSTIAAGIIAAGFVLAFFAVFWLRSKRSKNSD